MWPVQPPEWPQTIYSDDQPGDTRILGRVLYAEAYWLIHPGVQVQVCTAIASSLREGQLTFDSIAAVTYPRRTYRSSSI